MKALERRSRLIPTILKDIAPASYELQSAESLMEGAGAGDNHKEHVATDANEKTRQAASVTLTGNDSKEHDIISSPESASRSGRPDRKRKRDEARKPENAKAKANKANTQTIAKSNSAPLTEESLKENSEVGGASAGKAGAVQIWHTQIAGPEKGLEIARLRKKVEELQRKVMGADKA